eukprot:1102990-Alexandrium_andersonii.AAC.1
MRAVEDHHDTAPEAEGPLAATEVGGQLLRTVARLPPQEDAHALVGLVHVDRAVRALSLIHISEPTRLALI